MIDIVKSNEDLGILLQILYGLNLGHSHFQGARSLRYSGSSNSPGTSISKKRGSPPSLPVSQNVSYFQPTSHDGKNQAEQEKKKKRLR